MARVFYTAPPTAFRKLQVRRVSVQRGTTEWMHGRPGVLLVQLSQMNNTTNPKVKYSRSCLYDARNPLSRFTKVVVKGRENDPCPSEDASSDTGAT